MGMKRYPHGASGDFFFMKRAPQPRPVWVRTCSIDLNQWYARCDEIDRPDYVHIDMDSGPAATFDHVREAGLIVQALDALKMRSFVKTTGSRGLHVYVPIVRGPAQKMSGPSPERWLRDWPPGIRP